MLQTLMYKGENVKGMIKWHNCDLNFKSSKLILCVLWFFCLLQMEFHSSSRNEHVLWQACNTTSKYVHLVGSQGTLNQGN
jgi:hypothetical protein